MFTQVDKRTRLLRIMLSLLIVIAMFFGTAPLAVVSYAAGSSYSFDDYITFLCYSKAGFSVKSDDYSLTCTDNSLTDLAYAKTSSYVDTATEDIAKVWKLISGINDMKINGKIDAVKQPNLQKASVTANMIISSTSQAVFTEQVTAVYNAAKSLQVDAGTGRYKAAESVYDSKLRTAVGNFNAASASSAATDVFESIYGAENWNPDTGLATEAMAVVYTVVNVIFTVVAQLIMWFFMAQSAFDLFYISFEPIRPFIGPRDSGGGLSSNNGEGSLLSKIRIPICSNAAVEAANGSDKGGLNGGAGTNSSKAAISYVIKRAPLLITIAIYFILSVMGYWTKVIGWVADLVIKIFNFILSIGG